MSARISYVSIPVGDLAAATEGRWVELAAGDVKVALYPREDDGRGGEIAFAVRGLDGVKAELESAGVKFPRGVETFDVGGQRGRLARFLDPWGNELELIES